MAVAGVKILCSRGDRQARHRKLRASAVQLGDGFLGIAGVDPREADQPMRVVLDVRGDLVVGDLGVEIVALEPQNDGAVDRLGGGQMPRYTGRGRGSRSVRRPWVSAVRRRASPQLCGGLPRMGVAIDDHACQITLCSPVGAGGTKG